MSRPRCKTCARRGDNCRCGSTDLMALLKADREPGSGGASRPHGRYRRRPGPPQLQAGDAEYRKALGLPATGKLPKRLGTC